jgi:hypothetical protein
MATKAILTCDWCGKIPQWMDKPSDSFLYTASLKFVQHTTKYEFCSRECMYALMRSVSDGN